MKNTSLLNKLTISFLFSGFISLSIGQTGPGGIKSSAEVQIWLDAEEITGASNGNPFSIWPDRSGNGNNFTQGTSSYQPTYTTGGINGKPHVDFFGDYMDSPAIPALDVQDMTWLFVGAFNDQSTVYEVAINHNYDVNREYQNLTVLQPNSNIVAQIVYAFSGKVASAASTTNDRIYFGMRNGTRLSNYEDNLLAATRNDCNIAAAPSGHNYCRIGMRAGNLLTWPFRGDMYEVIVINTALNSAEINILNNYLAAKYDRTITNDQYDFQASYGENVIGIGQESDGSNLTATGQGVVTLSGADDLQDGEYLYLGDDDVNLGSTSTNVPAAIAGNSRYERLWRIDEVGDVGNVTVTLDLNIFSPGPDPSQVTMLVNSLANGTDMSLATVVNGTYNVGPNTVTFPYNPAAGDYISFAGSDQDIFTVASGAWSNPSTWSCNCIPTASDSVSILTGHGVILNAQTRAVRTLLIQSGGALNLVNGGALTVTEDIDAIGSLDGIDGTYTFAGPADQSLNLSQDAEIDNIVVMSGGTFTITGGNDFIINGSLDINANIDNTNTNLIINSSPSGDGRIGPNSGFTFATDVTIRRYLPPGDAEFREVTPLTFDFQFSQWDDEMVISGSGFPDGCATQAGSCYFSVKSYDGTDWVDMTDINAGFIGFKGSRMWIGDDLNVWSGGTLESSGTPKTGPIVGVGHDEWNFIGNSYPSAIDFEELRAASLNMDYYFYIYNPNSASYEWYDAGATGVLDQYIAMGQGFWVKSSNGNPVVFSLNESHKTNEDATFKKPAALSGLIMKVSSAKSPYSSKIAFNISEDASILADSRDMEYLPTYDNSAPHISALNEYGKEMMVNYFNENDNEAQFSLVAEVPAAGYYKINVENLRNLEEYNCIHLIDLETNEVINLREEIEYTFYAGVLKSDDPRFIVSFNKDACEENIGNNVLSTPISSIEDESIEVRNFFGNIQSTFNFNETTEVRITVTNSLGQTVHNVESINVVNGTHTFNVNSTGIVFINYYMQDKVITKKIFISK